MTDKERLIELINRQQDYGVVYERSQMDDRKANIAEVPNSVLATYLIENGVIIKDIEEEIMVYFPFPIDCEKCSKAIEDIGVCEGLDLLYDGKHPKYTKTQDWEFMCNTCPYEVVSRKYREEDDKDFIGKTMFFTEEEADKALKEGYSDERIYRA